MELIRIFRTRAEIQKPHYTPEFRKINAELPDIAFIKRIFVKNETLFVAPKVFDLLQEQMNENTGTILCFEYKSSMSDEFVTDMHCFDKDELIIESDPFIIKNGDENTKELHVFYGSNVFEVVPKREGHKIANLKPGQLIQYKVNFKTDIQGMDEKQRTYREYNYLIEHVGTFEKIEKMNSTGSLDKLSKENVKIIDERKILK